MTKMRRRSFILAVVLLLSVMFSAFQAFADDPDEVSGSAEKGAKVEAIANGAGDPAATSDKQGTDVETTDPVTGKDAEADESVELKLKSVKALLSDRQLVRVELGEDQGNKIRILNGNRAEGLFEIKLERFLNGTIQEQDKITSVYTVVRDGALALRLSTTTDYMMNKIKIKYVGGSSDNRLMIGDRPVKNMTEFVELDIDQSEFVSLIKLKDAVAAKGKQLKELIITATEDLYPLKSEWETRNGVTGFSIRLKSKKSKELSISKLEYVEGKEIKLQLDRDVIYGEKFSVIYDPKDSNVDDHRLREGGPGSKKYIERQVLDVENLAEAIIINIERFDVAPYKKGEVGTATIELSSQPEIDFANFVLEKEDLMMEGATLVSVTQDNEKDDVYIIRFKDVKVDNNGLIALKMDKLGYELEGQPATNITIIEEKEPKDPPSTEPKDPVPDPQRPVPDKDQDPKKPEDTDRYQGGGGTARSSVRPDSTSSTIKEDPTPKADPSASNMGSKIALKIGSKEYQVLEGDKWVNKKMDVAPKIQNGATLLPARMIADILGVSVKYDAAMKKVSFFYNEGNEAEWILGEKFMTVNGERLDLTSGTLIENGRILLPISDMQKAFAKLGSDAKIAWDADAKVVTIEP